MRCDKTACSMVALKATPTYKEMKGTGVSKMIMYSWNQESEGVTGELQHNVTCWHITILELLGHSNVVCQSLVLECFMCIPKSRLPTTLLSCSAHVYH